MVHIVPKSIITGAFSSTFPSPSSWMQSRLLSENNKEGTRSVVPETNAMDGDPEFVGESSEEEEEDAVNDVILAVMEVFLPVDDNLDFDFEFLKTTAFSTDGFFDNFCEKMLVKLFTPSDGLLFVFPLHFRTTAINIATATIAATIPPTPSQLV